MYYFGQPVLYKGDQEGLLLFISESTYGSISYLVGFPSKAKQKDGFTIRSVSRYHCSSTWATQLLQDADKWKDYRFLWVEDDITVLGREPFRKQQRGESIRTYRLLKKIYYLDQRFKENQYVKTHNLPILSPVTDREETESDFDDEESQESDEPVPAW